MNSCVSNNLTFISEKNQKLSALRNKAREKDVTTDDKIRAGVGSVIGTAIPVALMLKKQKIKSLSKLNYNLSDMLTISASSIAGGVALGMIGENKKTNKNKLQEGLFQFLNASIPTWIAGGCLKLSENSKHFNNVFGKTGAMLGGLIIGMFGAASLSNIITDPKDKLPDRKLGLIDCIANIDDAIGILVLAKIPFVNKLHIETILPFIYSYSGYRAGKSN